MALPSDDLVYQKLDETWRMVNLLVKMVARQQEALNILAAKNRRVYYLDKQVKKLRKELKEKQ